MDGIGKSVFIAVVFALGIASIVALSMGSKPKQKKLVASDLIASELTRMKDQSVMAPEVKPPPPRVVRTIPIPPQQTPDWINTIKDTKASEPEVSAPQPTSVSEEPPVSSDKSSDTVPEHTVRRHWHSDEDICTRHGLHKVVTNHGRSWRCR